MEYTEQLANNHISVDCVVIGFDGEKLKVLLVKRMGTITAPYVTAARKVTPQ